MRFERRALPSRRDVTIRVTAVVLLASILYVFPGHVDFDFSYAGNPLDGLFYPETVIWVLEECGMVVLVAAIGAHVEKLRAGRSLMWRWPSSPTWPRGP